MVHQSTGFEQQESYDQYISVSSDEWGSSFCLQLPCKQYTTTASGKFLASRSKILDAAIARLYSLLDYSFCNL